jgi:hypothetical protein
VVGDERLNGDADGIAIPHAAFEVAGGFELPEFSLGQADREEDLAATLALPASARAFRARATSLRLRGQRCHLWQRCCFQSSTAGSSGSIILSRRMT